MVGEILEQLFEFTAKSIPSEKIFEAKRSYQKETGETYEDDKSYDTRMALFLEWFLFDNYPNESSNNVFDLLLAENTDNWDSDQIINFKKINENIQGLFLVKKVKGDIVKVLNLFTDNIYLVQEKDSGLIFRKNNIFQGRIINFQNHYFFTGNFCFHPKETHKFIKLEISSVANFIDQNKRDLAIVENGLLKEKKILQKQEINIAKLIDKIKYIDSDNKITNINQDLKILIEKKKYKFKIIEDLKNEIFKIKNNKIKIEGRKKINGLLNRFAYMNLKWERSRQIDITDIYKN